MYSKNNKKLKPSPVIKRLADHSDLDSLVNITKINFEDQALYQFSSLSRKYWNIALETESTEIWVWEIDGEIAALALIITDLETWNMVKQRWTNYNPAIRYFAYLLLPKTLFIKIKKRLRIIKDQYFLKKEDDPQPKSKSG
ncbi:MAG: hypothetical protein KJO12_03375, partial [Ignavibacteria bacterium]|nr:hypothetical protein [Ignavibacteria bacterium]